MIGLHEDGYGLLLCQSTFSGRRNIVQPVTVSDVVFWAAAGVMYAMWSSLSREKDPFTVIPAIPILEEYKDKWPKSRIRKEIFAAESSDLMQVSVF